jgi:hypothetical protein
MSFRLSSEARKYFHDIEERSTTGAFDWIWDQYYLAAMAGINAQQRVPLDEEPPQEQEFETGVIEGYSDQRYELYSAMIVAEVEREAIPWTEKQEIRNLMLDLLDSTSHTNLTDYGVSVLNCYAEQGYRLIWNQIAAPPELDEFLESYHKDVLESVA